MNEAVEVFRSHGAAILFLVVWLENMGAPVPSFPFLLAAGALAASGKLSLQLAFAAATVAAFLADATWYQLGRIAGRKILRWICLISLNPESCVTRTESVFSRYGLRSLLVAKYVPGLNTIAPPLCGLLGIPFWKFTAFDLAGCMIGVVPLIVAGFAFSRQLETLLVFLERFGNLTLVLLLLAAAAFISLKVYERRRFYRHLRTNRVSPAELHERLKSVAGVTVVDLRSPLAFETDLFSIPGSIRIAPDELEARVSEIPPDTELILYCT